jgi:hypothetical protein
VWAWLTVQTSGENLSFAGISGKESLYLLLAAGLRLGVLPLHVPFLSDTPRRRSLGSLTRLVPVAASLILLVRAASVGVPEGFRPYLLAFSGMAALYGSASWVSAKDELDGRPFWILAGASFSLAAAVRQQPEASLAWGLTTLLSGATLFLASVRPRILVPILLLSALSLTTLPFTPNWQGVRLYSGPLSPWLALFLLAQAALAAGYVRHTFRSGPDLSGVERWVWVIYPWGLALLPLVHYLIAWLGRGVPGFMLEGFPSVDQSWPGLAVLILVAGMGVWRQRGLPVPRRILTLLGQVFSFRWLYRWLWGSYKTAGRIIGGINFILEGDGGILWALLLLTLLFSLLMQRGLGG